MDTTKLIIEHGAKVRLIVQGDEDGTREFMQYTEDFDSPVSYFAISGCTIYSDVIIEMDLPSCFPLEYVFEKRM